MNVKDKIKMLAKECGTNIANLETTLGFGNGTIARWDKASPNLEKALLVADYFGVTLDFLFRDNVSTPISAEIMKNITEWESNEEKQRGEQLLNDFKNLNRQGQDYILQTMDLVKDKYKKSDCLPEVEGLG